MRILHIININAHGGAENLLTTFLPAMQDRGVETICAILSSSHRTSAAKTIAEQLREKGIPVHLYAYKSLFAISNFLWLRKIINRSGCDVTHSHLRYADIWLSLLKMFRLIRIPVVSTVHGYNDDYMNKYGLEVKKGIGLTAYYRVTKWVTRKMDGIIFISACMKDFYARAAFTGTVRNVVIYHGYPPVTQEENSRSRDIWNDPQLVLAGRIIERKGHVYALQALKKLKQDYPGACLHLLGKGPFEGHLKELVIKEGLQDSVIFHGYRSNIVEAIREYDIALLPSYWEPFGLVFLDAFAAGRPVVAFDLPAGNEIIRHGFNGLLAQPYESGSLCHEVSQLCRNREQRITLSRNAHQDLKRRFSMERMAEEYQIFYTEIVRINESRR